MLKNILAVIAGYVIFVISSIALFYFSGQKAHAAAELSFKVFTAAYGFAFSFLSGWFALKIAQAKTLKINLILALIIAGFATFSWIKADGEHWTQFLAITVFAPTSVLGGYYGIQRKKSI